MALTCVIWLIWKAGGTEFNSGDTDPAFMLALAAKESSLLPNRKAQTSSAEGLFQFADGTWLEVLRRYGSRHGYRSEAKAIQIVRARPVVSDRTQRERILNLRRDPYLSALMTGEMIATHTQDPCRQGGARIRPSAELYMAHFLSVCQGASRFMELLRDGPRAAKACPARRQGLRVRSRATDELA